MYWERVLTAPPAFCAFIVTTALAALSISSGIFSSTSHASENFGRCRPDSAELATGAEVPTRPSGQ